MRRPVGKCGYCGGLVTAPDVWLGMNPPPQTCFDCGATVNEAANLPVLPMHPPRSPFPAFNEPRLGRLRVRCS